jgi:hypothetical protein
MLRKILAVVGAILAASAVVFLVELVIPLIWPLPDEVARAVKEYPPNVEKIRALVDQFPPGAFVGVLAGWLLGAVSGAVVATLIPARTSLVPGLVFGGFFLVVCLANLFMLRIHPPWFWAATLVLVPAAAYLGARMAAGKRGAA